MNRRTITLLYYYSDDNELARELIRVDILFCFRTVDENEKFAVGSRIGPGNVSRMLMAV